MHALNHSDLANEKLSAGDYVAAMYYSFMALQNDKSDWAVIRTAAAVEKTIGAASAARLMLQHTTLQRRQNYRLALAHFINKSELTDDAYQHIVAAFINPEERVNVRHLINAIEVAIKKGDNTWIGEALRRFAGAIAAELWSIDQLIATLKGSVVFVSLARQLLDSVKAERLPDLCKERLATLSVIIYGDDTFLSENGVQEPFVAEYFRYYNENTRENAGALADGLLCSPRFCSDTDLAVTIEDCIARRQPFSFVRMGDGEGRVVADLSSYPEISTRTRETAARIWFWNSTTYPAESFFAQLRKSFIDASVVGINPRLRIDGEAVGSAIGYVGVTAGNLFVAEVATKPRVAHNWAHITLDKRRFFHRILDTLEKEGRMVNVICPYPTLDYPLSPLNERKNLRLIRVPSDGSRLLKRLSIDEPHYPVFFDRLCSRIDSTSGELFLVAAGAFAKIYCDRARDAGNVAIDVGSLLDTWMGVKTR